MERVWRPARDRSGRATGCRRRLRRRGGRGLRGVEVALLAEPGRLRSLTSSLGCPRPSPLRRAGISADAGHRAHGPPARARPAPPGRPPRRHRPAAFDQVTFRYPGATAGPRPGVVRGPEGAGGRRGEPLGLGQDHADAGLIQGIQAAQEGAVRLDGRRHPAHRPRAPAAAGRGGAPGQLPVPRHHPREHRRDAAGRGPGG